MSDVLEQIREMLRSQPNQIKATLDIQHSLRVLVAEFELDQLFSGSLNVSGDIHKSSNYTRSFWVDFKFTRPFFATTNSSPLLLEIAIDSSLISVLSEIEKAGVILEDMHDRIVKPTSVKLEPVGTQGDRSIVTFSFLDVPIGSYKVHHTLKAVLPPELAIETV